MTRPLLQAAQLRRHYVVEKTLLGRPVRSLKAVDGVSLSINAGETFGLVGESGCGKSTLGRLLIRLDNATGGDVRYSGESLMDMDKAAMRAMRQKLQIIFQDPYASLNPRRTVQELIRAPLDAFSVGSPAQRLEQVADIMHHVGLAPQHMHRYPHEFSGGQRQRIVIARALILGPEFVVCDEPVSALDVSVRSQIINLMAQLQRQRKLTYLFISHDLSVVKYICDRVAVMYLGKIVEYADKTRLFAAPAHPYTQALLSAIPQPTRRPQGSRIVLCGDLPSPIDCPSGCRFHTRCPHATQRCRQEEPVLREIALGQFAACHLAGGQEGGGPPHA